MSTIEASSFDLGVDELRDTSQRISAGLDRILSVIETVAQENAAFLKPNGGAKPNGGSGARSLEDTDEADDEIAALQDLLGQIRSEVRGVNKLGHEFERKLIDHSERVVDLNETLEETRRKALLDPLTGIPNRRSFEATLKRVLSDVKSMRGQLAVLLGDVDDFKHINDGFGHQVGDQVLRLVASTLRECLRESDSVARWGGDEFAAVLPSTDEAQALTVAQHICEKLDHKTMINRQTGEQMGKIGMSIGATGYVAGDTLESILERADEAMYAAKKAKKKGRDRVAPG